MQPVKQLSTSLLLRIGFQTVTQLRVFFHAAEPVILQQRLDVKACATHQDGKGSPLCNLMDQFRGLLLEICHTVGSIRGQDIYQMMRYYMQLIF